MAVRIEVAAAIVRDQAGRILLSQRPEHKHQGGCWEFPGGKLEAGETPEQALSRELAEELDLAVATCRPFMTIEHDYPELTVRLYFREVTEWTGTPRGLEGQPVGWFAPSALFSLDFPAANRPVVTALNLPDCFAVLPDNVGDDWWPALADLASGSGLYLRGLEKTPDRLLRAAEHCRKHGIPFMVRDDASLAEAVGATVLHFGSERLRRGNLPSFAGLRSAAVHDEFEMSLARKAGLDMVFLSPVAATPSHPDREPLGWKRFSELATGMPLAVYALGGVAPEDLYRAREAGARGVAGIRAFFASGTD